MKSTFKPRKIFFLRISSVVIFLSSFIIIHGCRKEFKTTRLDLPTGTVATEMQQWLITQKTDSLKSLSINNLIGLAQWSNAHAALIDTLSTYDIVPLQQQTVISFDDASKDLEGYLVLIKSKGSIVNSFIMRLYGDKTDLATMSDPLIVGYKLNAAPGFSGMLIMTTIMGTFEESKEFRAGQLFQRKAMLQQQKGTGKTIQSTGKKLADQYCIDWYLVTYDDNGAEINREFIQEDCYGDNTCSFQPQMNKHAVLSIKTSCGSDPIVLSPLDSLRLIIKGYCDNVSASQQQEIQDAITGFKNDDCVQAGIFNYFVTKKTQFIFCTSDTLTRNAIIDIKAQFNITFSSNAIASTVLGHEFFHGYQDSIYTGGTYQYESHGRSDIEFEQAFWHDILSPPTIAGAMYGAAPSDITDYLNWLSSVTNHGTTYPKSIADVGQTTYNHFLDIFYTLNPRYGPPIYLTPKAAFQSFIQFGCR